MKDEHGFEVPISRAGSVRTPTTPALLRRISWGAIFAGTVVALAVQLLLSLLGIGIGASSIDPYQQNPGKGFGIGAGLWFLISSLVAMYAGACVAGRLSGASRTDDRALHGVITWAVATLFTIFLLTTAVGGVIGGAAGLMSKALPATGSGDLQSQLQRMGVDTEALKQQAQSVLPGAPTGRSQLSDEQKQQLEQKAREAGEVAARGVAKAAFWSFVILVLSGAAAVFGGNRGTPEYPVRRAETVPAT